MVKILQRYVLREVTIPTALTILTLVFVLVVRMVFTKAEHLAGAVTVTTLGWFMLYLFPALLSQAIPMAMLIGVLLGIGRLTVDSEIKAMRAHGVSLFRVFTPLLVLSAVMTGVVLYVSLETGPGLLGRSMSLLDRAKFELINSLQPGRPYDDFGLSGSEVDVILYFDSKEADGRMHNVYVSVHGGFDSLDEGSAEDEIADDDIVGGFGREAVTGLRDRSLVAGNGGVTPLKRDARDDGSLDDDGGATDSLSILPSWMQIDAALAEATKDRPPVPLDPDREPDVVDVDDDLEEGLDTTLAETKTLILAASGKIQGDPENQQAFLDLFEGSIHFLRGRDDPRYTVVDFKQMRQNFDLDISTSSQDGHKRKVELMTLSEMLWEIGWRMKAFEARDPEDTNDQDEAAPKRVRQLRAELYTRIAIALACFTFVLIGIPLAILTKPSGKSIGITIAFFIILAFYGVTRYGVELTRTDSVMGPAVIFLPNVVLTVMGALMFYRTVHR